VVPTDLFGSTGRGTSRRSTQWTLRRHGPRVQHAPDQPCGSAGTSLGKAFDGRILVQGQGAANRVGKGCPGVRRQRSQRVRAAPIVPQPQDEQARCYSNEQFQKSADQGRHRNGHCTPISRSGRFSARPFGSAPREPAFHFCADDMFGLARCGRGPHSRVHTWGDFRPPRPTPHGLDLSAGIVLRDHAREQSAGGSDSVGRNVHLSLPRIRRRSGSG
jgi:hypothetical protein